jgi:hypothetical protein
MNHGEPVVVETDKERWVGTAELTAEHVVIRSGRAGRPKMLKTSSVMRITPLDASLE